MAYVIGYLTPDEEAELQRRGWEIEPAPSDLVPTKAKDPDRIKMVWVDTSMFDVMNGPDWDKGPDKG